MISIEQQEKFIELANDVFKRLNREVQNKFFNMKILRGKKHLLMAEYEIFVEDHQKILYTLDSRKGPKNAEVITKVIIKQISKMQGQHHLCNLFSTEIT